jgi:hypothetical protein
MDSAIAVQTQTVQRFHHIEKFIGTNPSRFLPDHFESEFPSDDQTEQIIEKDFKNLFMQTTNSPESDVALAIAQLNPQQQNELRTEVTAHFNWLMVQLILIHYGVGNPVSAYMAACEKIIDTLEPKFGSDPDSINDELLIEDVTESKFESDGTIISTYEDILTFLSSSPHMFKLPQFSFEMLTPDQLSEIYDTAVWRYNGLNEDLEAIDNRLPLLEKKMVTLKQITLLLKPR